jgi:hypothetical protein
MANTPVPIEGANTIVGYSVTLPFTITDVYTFSFPYLSQSDFEIKVNSETVLDAADYEFTSDYLIQLTTVGRDKLNALYTTGTATMVIRRKTQLTTRLVDFQDGSTLTQAELDLNSNQAFYLIQEATDDTALSPAFNPVDGSLDMASVELINVAEPTLLTSAATLTTVLSEAVTPEYTTGAKYRSGRLVFDSGDLIRANKDILDGAAFSAPAVRVGADWDDVLTAAQIVDIANVSANTAKLLTIESGAKDDQTGAEIKVAYEAEADTNAFTDADATKLSTVQANATDDQTGSEIKIAYEAEADTNAFTDADVTKLGTIESSAKDDQTGAEIKIAYEGEVNTNAYTDTEVTKVANSISNVMTTVGDVVYGGASGVQTRLPIGTENQVLTVKSGIPSYEDATGGVVTTWEMYEAHTHGGYGSVNNKIPYFSTVVSNSISVSGTISNSSANGWSFTATVRCKIDLQGNMEGAVTLANLGISLNSTQLTTIINSITAAHRKSLGIVSTIDNDVAIINISHSRIMEIGDVIRFHNSAITPATASRSNMTLTVQTI